MADSKAPSPSNVTSKTRSQARKQRIVGGQEEENDSGFRFTRRSKRILAQEKVQPQTSDENKDAVKDAKRRRSSFIRGRKIHSPLEICKSKKLAAVQGFYKEIPANLSHHERLLQLLDKSFLLMCESFKDAKYSNIPNFSEKVKEFVEYHQTILKNSETAKRATEQSDKVNERVLLPNPKAQQLEEYAKKSEETKERMLKEDKEWEEVLQKYENEHDSTESDVMASYDKTTKDCLSEEQQEFLESLKPKEGILENLQQLKDESVLMIDKIVTTASTVKALNIAAERYLDKTTEELIESPTPMSMCATPRHLIHAITKDSMDLS